MPFETGKLFRVTDRDALKRYMEQNFNDPSVNWDSWETDGVPEYIILTGKYDEYNDAPYSEDDAAPDGQEQTRMYDSFDVHVNKNVSWNSWFEYRLEYLLEEGILEDEGHYYDFNRLDEYYTNTKDTNLAQNDDLDTLE